MKAFLDLCRHPLFLSILGAAFLAASSLMITEHIRAVHHVRATSVPLVSQLPELERRRDLLKQQVELAQFHAALRIGSQEERVFVHVLPAEIHIDRVMAMFDVLTLALEQRSDMSDISPIEVGEKIQTDEGYSAIPLSFSLAIRTDAIASLIDVLRLAGTLTIADTLTDTERSLLFERTELENPAGIVALEKFLSTDLLEYAKEPRPHERQLRQSLAGPGFSMALDSIMEKSFLPRSVSLLTSPLGQLLDKHSLWPMPLMTIEEVGTRKGGADGWEVLSLKLLVYERIRE